MSERRASSRDTNVYVGAETGLNFIVQQRSLNISLLIKELSGHSSESNAVTQLRNKTSTWALKRDSHIIMPSVVIRSLLTPPTWIKPHHLCRLATNIDVPSPSPSPQPSATFFKAASTYDRPCVVRSPWIVQVGHCRTSFLAVHRLACCVMALFLNLSFCDPSPG